MGRSCHESRSDLRRASDKDALIADLRRQLAAAQSEARVLRRRLDAATVAERPPADTSRAGTARRAARRRAAQGRCAGQRRGETRPPLRSLAVAGRGRAGHGAADGLRGRCRRRHVPERALREARRARLLLENTAMRSLYVELKGITYDPDGKSYRIDAFPAERQPEGPLYVMLNAVAVYVQSGMAWQRVPSRPWPRA